MDEVFAETSVFINDDERIIVREPEYLDGLMSVLKDTPQKVVGTYMKESSQWHFWTQFLSDFQNLKKVEKTEKICQDINHTDSKAEVFY